MFPHHTSDTKKLRVVQRSDAYASCERCGDSATRGLSRCEGCGTVYEHRMDTF